MRLQANPILPEVVQALASPGRLTGRLNGRKKQCDEQANNRYGREEFYE